MAKIPVNLAAAMKKAGRIRSEMEKITAEGSAGGELVRVKANAGQQILECKIDPQVFAEKDAEFLEDLIVAAANQALRQANQAGSEHMSRLVRETKLMEEIFSSDSDEELDEDSDEDSDDESDDEQHDKPNDKAKL